jgi:hypothetical protein
MTCWNAESFPGVCGHKRAAKKDEKAKAAKDKAKAEKKEAQRREELRRQSQQNAQRLLRAIDAADLTDEEKFRFEDYDYYPAVSVSELRDAAEGKFGDKTLYSVQYAPASRKRIIEFSQRLGCSADYLLGLTDELRPCRRAWSTGLPEHDCCVFGKFSFDGIVYNTEAVFDAAVGEFRYSHIGERLEGECVAWVELPDDAV